MPAKRLLMEECWNKFWREVRPANAPPDQAREMRRAFYAGGHAILFKVIFAFAPEAEPTEADMQIMADLHQELLDFAKKVEKGEA
jgi:hypothetical protein